MPFETINYRTEGPLAHIELNRPQKLNAISGQMVNELNVALGLAEADESVRVVILSGRGKAFSAGFDLETDSGGDIDALRKELKGDFNVIMRFWNCPKPTIAAVHTYCLGGAMELAVACDITVSAEHCRFGEPEVKFGSGIVALLLPWLTGPKKAKEWLLTGNDRITPEEAALHGLVNRVVPGDELMDTAREIALTIARNDALAVRKTKRAVNLALEIAGMKQALAEALEIDIEIETTETEESREFNRILKEEGVRAAIAWRDARLSPQQDQV